MPLRPAAISRRTDLRGGRGRRALASASLPLRFVGHDRITPAASSSVGLSADEYLQGIVGRLGDQGIDVTRRLDGPATKARRVLAGLLRIGWVSSRKDLKAFPEPVDAACLKSSHR